MSDPAPYAVRARNIDPDADNRIHDDEVARRFGFSGALVPGVELFAYLTHPLVAAWGEEWLRGGRLDVSFRRPVYDGELVVATAEPSPDGTLAVGLTGPDGTVRVTGTATPPRPQRPPDLSRYVEVPPTGGVLPPAGPASLPPGPMGTVSERVDEAAAGRYVDAVAEPLPLYRRVVHPGLLLRVVNAALFRNVALGPWIHTGSNCRLLAPAPVPSELTCRSSVTDRYDKGGHSWVRYDALVLAGDVAVMEVDHWAIYALRPS